MGNLYERLVGSRKVFVHALLCALAGTIILSVLSLVSSSDVGLPEADQKLTMTPTVFVYDEYGCPECAYVHGSGFAQEKFIETPAADDAPIDVVYFYQQGCEECERAEHDLAYIREKYPQVQIERLKVKDDAAFNRYLCEETGVPKDKHLTVPALFIGHEYLLGREIGVGAIEHIIAGLRGGGSPPWWVGWEARREYVE